MDQLGRAIYGEQAAYEGMGLGMFQRDTDILLRKALYEWKDDTLLNAASPKKEDEEAAHENP